MTNTADVNNEEWNTLGSKHCGLTCSITKQAEGIKETPASNPQVWATGQLTPSTKEKANLIIATATV